MPSVKLFNIEGKEVGQVQLSEEIFGIEPNEGVVHEAVVMQLASMRRGTSSTKHRGEVRGGGRKPWRQRVQVELEQVQLDLHYGVGVQ